jgi:O-antigen ligase
LNTLLIPIIFSAVRERRHVVLVITAFIVGAALSGVYGLFVPAGSNSIDSGRLVGALGDSNYEAVVLVAGLILAVGIGSSVRSPRFRAVAASAAALAIIGFVQKLSRGGLISLACVLLAGLLVGGRWRRTFAALLVIALAGFGVYFFALASGPDAQRVTSANTSGRADIWTIAWRAFSAHPLTGVGANNFQATSVHYLQRPGSISSALYIVDIPRVVHNVYLEQLADLGIPGLLTLLAVVGVVIATGIKAAHIFERIGDRQLELLSRCVVLALVGFLSADFFISQITSKQLWIVMGLCPALLRLARSAERRAPTEQRWTGSASYT